MAAFTCVNCDAKDLQGPALPSAFSLHAPPKSDIYASPGPPALFVYTAPVVCKRIRKDAFSKARVTVTAKWTKQFDQGGLVFTLPRNGVEDPDGSNANTSESHPAWVKIGIETNDGAPYTSIVARSAEGWCDWSMAPLGKRLHEVTSLEMEVTRLKNALMIWVMDGSTRMLVRKIPWVFLDDTKLSSDMLVGVFAAQPDPFDEAKGEDLEVSFFDFTLETNDGL